MIQGTIVRDFFLGGFLATFALEVLSLFLLIVCRVETLGYEFGKKLGGIATKLAAFVVLTLVATVIVQFVLLALSH